MYAPNAVLSLQEECEMYLTGQTISDYDEEDPLTYYMHRRIPVLGKFISTSTVLFGHFCTIRTGFLAYRD